MSNRSVARLRWFFSRMLSTLCRVNKFSNLIRISMFTLNQQKSFLHFIADAISFKSYIKHIWDWMRTVGCHTCAFFGLQNIEDFLCCCCNWVTRFTSSDNVKCSKCYGLIIFFVSLSSIVFRKIESAILDFPIRCEKGRQNNLEKPLLILVILMNQTT